MFGKTRLFVRILPIFMCVLYSPAYASDDFQSDYKLIKVSTEEEIEPLQQETDGLARNICNEFENSYDPDGPFGIYRLEVNQITVGYKSLYPVNEDGSEVTTYIFKPYRGQGYGTILRRLVCQSVERFLGSHLNLSAVGQVRMSPKAFRYITSYNAWHWGENGATLASALKAGYGVANIQAHEAGMVLLLYPKFDFCWDDKRVDALLKFSRLWRGYDQPQPCAHLLAEIIAGLDLSQHRHLATTCAVLYRLKDLSDKDISCNRAIRDFFNNLEKPRLDMLRAFVYQGCVSPMPQEMPDCWLLTEPEPLSKTVLKAMIHLLKNSSAQSQGQ